MNVSSEPAQQDIFNRRQLACVGWRNKRIGDLRPWCTIEVVDSASGNLKALRNVSRWCLLDARFSFEILLQFGACLA